MSKIKFGWGEVSLVPQGKKVDLAGQFYERITDVVEDEITVTALAMECGEDSAIFCACDLVSTGHQLLDTIREKLKDRPDIPADKILVSAIHTHTGPGFARRSDSVKGKTRGGLEALTDLLPNVKYERLAKYEGDDLFEGEEAHDFLATRIAEAAALAWDNRKEGMYATGFGRAAVGMCRRVVYDDGSAKMWGDTSFANFETLEAGNDSGIELIFTYTPDKTLTGVIANVACPAQVLEHRSFISSDYWGKVKKLLREKYGEEIFLLGLCSAAGDQCPRDMIRWVQPETPINDPNIIRNDPVERGADPSMFDLSGCKKVARRIKDEIVYALEEVSEYVSDTTLDHTVCVLDVPLRRVTVAQMESAREAIRRFGEENDGKTINFVDKARMHIHAGTINRYKLQQEVDTFPNELHFLKLGNIAFATNPYELFLDYGNKIRARSPARQTFLIQLCCGSWGYLPTKRAEEGSHYSAYVSSGYAGHEGGDLLVRKTLTELNKLFEA